MVRHHPRVPLCKFRNCPNCGRISSHPFSLIPISGKLSNGMQTLIPLFFPRCR
jgi:hypothetical protein